MTSVLKTLAMQNTTQQSGGSLGVSIEIIGATVLACVLLTATVLLLSRYKRRREAMVLRERQARREMQELCPDGWAARIVLYGDGAPLPDDAPGRERSASSGPSTSPIPPATPPSPWPGECGPGRSRGRSAACSPTDGWTTSSRRSNRR